jgi:hypothetical protein
MTKYYFSSLPVKIKNNDEDFKATYKSVEVVKDQGSGTPFVKLTDLSIAREHGDKTGKVYRFEEPCIILSSDMPFYQFWELVVDLVGEVELIKLAIPQLKIKILNFFTKENSVYANSIKNFVDVLKEKGFFEAYELNENDIIDLRNFDSIEISSCFFIGNYKESGMYKIFVDSLEEDWEETRTGHLLKVVQKSMREKFLKKDLPSPYKKIFISRMRHNDSARILSETIQGIFHGYPMNESEKHIEKNSLAKLLLNEYSFITWTDRVPTKRDENKIENFFRENGYEIIDLSDYPSLFEQAKLFNSAKYIVGLAGAAFLNTMFCNKEANVLVLNTADSYNFPHEIYIKYFGIKNSFVTPRRKVWKEMPNSATHIISEVKRNNPEFLGML